MQKPLLADPPLLLELNARVDCVACYNRQRHTCVEIYNLLRGAYY